jgi:CSLREA domain-containing protein
MRSAAARRLITLVATLGLLASLAPVPALAAGIVVNSLADDEADDGECTLREAIAAADTDIASGAMPGECPAGAGADTITFNVSGTITLLGSDVLSSLFIFSSLTIDGGGAITISGNNTQRARGVFFVVAGTVTLSGLTITAGSALPAGGGILNDGDLTVTNSTISGNTAPNDGGGITNRGLLAVTNSTITGNSSHHGAGIRNIGTATITNSTISGNTSANQGGGIYNDGGALTVTNSTISGNTAVNQGGGIFADAAETLRNAIVAGNTAPDGPDIIGSVDVASNTLDGDATDILDPAGLADNGGPTQTIALALVAGNPAVDAGDTATCAAAPVSGLDQRGQPRPSACDIGAYEAQPPTIAAHADVSAAATSASGAAVTFTPPTGTDEQGDAATVACLPASGSTFAVGSTTVTCTATDAVGHTASGTFQVIVGAFTPPTTPTSTPTVTPSPTPSPSLLPNTAFGDHAQGVGSLPLALASLSLLSLALLGRATRPGRRRA